MTRTELDYYMRQWRIGNDAGDGYSVGDDTDTPAEAAEREGWVVIGELDSTGTGKGACVLALTSDYRQVVIGDANGAWAVDVAAYTSSRGLAS